MKKIRSVFIVGWYGTETVGDKAILGSILNFYRRQNPQVSFSVASFYPFVTRRTLLELGVGAVVLPAYSTAFFIQAAIADVVVMGGGPLMDIAELAIPLWAFRIAKLFGRRRVVYGCGLGPLRKPRYQAVVRHILQLATDICLRDSQSVALAKELSGRVDIKLGQDPAIDYVAERIQVLCGQVSIRPNDIIACFLRDWPREYAGDLSDDEYNQIKTHYETNLARCIKNISFEHNLHIGFFPMHSFVVGGDDRIFYRRFIKQFFPDSDRVYWESQPTSVDDILLAMLQARVCVCMRFHSVLFAHTLKKPYVAIDYSNHGKIYSFMQDVQAMEDYISLFDLVSGSDALLASRLRIHLQTTL